MCVCGCRRAGRSRVQYVGIDFGTWWRHVLRRDFFTTAVNAKLSWLLGALFFIYFTMLFTWALVYWSIWRCGTHACMHACKMHTRTRTCCCTASLAACRAP